MTSRPIWMPLFVGDYLRDTRHLTTLQHGAYLLLIMEYWSKGKLPSTDSERRRVTAMTTKQWLTNRSAIAAMFGPDWRHDRIERELQKANDLRLKRAVFGAKGGRMSRGRDNVERFGVVRGFPTKR
jgi:uncharacterized protein YdaU (DUF1376 family)